LLSIVTKTSTLPVATRRSSPFFFPAHPASGTVFTSCSLRCFFNPRGRHSSSSTRISSYRFAGDVKYGGDLFPADRRKIVKEIVHTIPDLQVIHQRLDWNAGSIEDGRPREDLRVDTDRRLE